MYSLTLPWCPLAAQMTSWAVGTCVFLHSQAHFHSFRSLRTSTSRLGDIAENYRFVYTKHYFSPSRAALGARVFINFSRLPSGRFVFVRVGALVLVPASRESLFDIAECSYGSTQGSEMSPRLLKKAIGHPNGAEGHPQRPQGHPKRSPRAPRKSPRAPQRSANKTKIIYWPLMEAQHET